MLRLEIEAERIFILFFPLLYTLAMRINKHERHESDSGL